MVGKIPWRKKWQLTPELLPRKSHGQRSLEDGSPWGSQRVRHNLAPEQQQKKNNLKYFVYTNIFHDVYPILFLYRITLFILGTLPTKVRLVKAMVFPVVMYGCESWTSAER